MRSRIRKGKVLRSHLDSVLGVGSPRALELSVLDEGPLAAAHFFVAAFCCDACCMACLALLTTADPNNSLISASMLSVFAM